MNTSSAETFGERVRRLREAHAMTQVELAVRANLNPVTIVRVEAGGPAQPLTIKKLARALGVKPRMLTTGEQP